MEPSYEKKAAALLQSEADTRRPLIHHINADTSWLLQLPREGPRPFYNILIDPWLAEPQVEYAPFFHSQSHTEPSAFQSIAEIDAFVHELEDRATAIRNDGTSAAIQPATRIDAVACSFSGTDHVNPHTLHQVHSSVPIFLPRDAMKTVRSWKHFTTVVQLDKFLDVGGDWRRTSKSPLPDWLGIGWLVQKRDIQTIHKGLVITFDVGSGPEAVVYMAHGIVIEDLVPVREAAPDLRVLALLHGLMLVRVGFWLTRYSPANLGAHNGLKAQRLLEPKYWIGTHDEFKDESGMTAWMLSKVRYTLEEALEKERQEKGEGYVQGGVNWRQLENGEGMVLA